MRQLICRWCHGRCDPGDLVDGMPGLPGSRKAAAGKIQNGCKDHEQPVLSDGIKFRRS